MNDSQQGSDGYTYNSYRNIRTSNFIERPYQDREDKFIAFITSSDFKSFPSISK